jgi:WD40 repeat protein
MDQRQQQPPSDHSVTDMMPETNPVRWFVPSGASSSMFLYAEGSTIVCCQHDTLHVERRFDGHNDDVQLLAVDNVSEAGSGRLVVTSDAGSTAIVWDSTTGRKVCRISSEEQLTTVVWMWNGDCAFGECSWKAMNSKVCH